MTAIHQGVTLERSTDVTLVDALREVHYGGRCIGLVYPALIPAQPDAHYATPDDYRFRILPTRDAAVRWVCLQARPVVYQVRPIHSPTGDLFAWWVISPDGGFHGPHYTHPDAMTLATQLARRTLERTL